MRGGATLRVVSTVLAGAALVAGAGLTETRWILEGASREPDPVRQARSAPVEDRTLVCPGPETLGVPGLPVGRASAAQVVAAGAPAGVPGLSGAPGVIRLVSVPGATELRATTSAAAVGVGAEGSASVLVAARGGLAPGVAAAQQTLVPDGDARGLVSVPCGEPTAESWLVAGSGQAGRQEHLVLTNPYDTPVSVDVSVLGTRGAVVGVAGKGIVVEPRGRTVVLLDALDASEAAPVAHVVVHGGAVHAVLHDGWLDGIVARGQDDAAAAESPARTLVMPAVTVGGETDPAVVRVAVPGGAPTDVHVSVLGPSGHPARRLPPRRVRGGSSQDVGLPPLPRGDYAVRVDADVPVVAAAMIGRADGGRPPGEGTIASPVHDFAWVPALPPQQHLGGLPLVAPRPEGGSRRLVVVNPGARPSATTVTLVGAQGPERRSLQVPSAGTASLDLGAATSVWLPGSQDGLRAAVVTEAQGGLITVTPIVGRPTTTVPYAVAPAR